MTELEKLTKMFIVVHGDINNTNSSCYLEPVESEDFDNYGEAMEFPYVKMGRNIGISLNLIAYLIILHKSGEYGSGN